MKLNSSAILEATFFPNIPNDNDDGELHLLFRQGKKAVYEFVPQSVYEGLINAESVGKYFQDNIKEEYSWYYI